MVSQAKMLVKGENWVHGAKDQDDQVGQIKQIVINDINIEEGMGEASKT